MNMKLEISLFPTYVGKYLEIFDAIYSIDADEAWQWAEHSALRPTLDTFRQRTGITNEFGRARAFHYALHGGDMENIQVRGTNVEILD